MKHREIIIAMANKKKVEYLNCEGIWCKGDQYVNPLSQPSLIWRIAPKILSINGMEFPAPVNYRLKDAKYLVTVCLHSPHSALEREYFFQKGESDARQMYEVIVKACTP